MALLPPKLPSALSSLCNVTISTKDEEDATKSLLSPVFPHCSVLACSLSLSLSLSLSPSLSLPPSNK